MKTMADVAAEVGISKSYLSLLLTGRRNARRNISDRLALFFDCDHTVWGEYGTLEERRRIYHAFIKRNQADDGD